MIKFNSLRQFTGNSIPDPSDSDGEMEASGMSAAPTQGNLL